MDPVTGSFDFEGHRLVYDEYGSGDRLVVLLPGLLFSRKMHRPLAETLAEDGHRVICLDLLGHGDSDRPPEMTSYGMQAFGRQAIALLDHLEVEQAVIGGTSLGANATLGGRRGRARARARAARGDAGARQRAARLRDRVHPAAGELDLWRSRRRGCWRR